MRAAFFVWAVKRERSQIHHPERLIEFAAVVMAGRVPAISLL
jgi:hypothetical protein